ncbi:hypothetical protein ACTQ50_05555 [Blautia sp. Sow4_E7]|uniref:hypothetical protein n=1 Tax=Blautia sp. Sow4_E7 TaxID=3438749 RepID=UPI003F92C267
MGKIIQFQQRKEQKAVSNGYDNLSRLIAIAATKEVLNFYIESIGQLEKRGSLLDGEAEKLEEQGRAKRLEIALPEKKEPEKVTGSGTYSYYPEMGEQKPDCQMEAILSYYGKHYFVDTPIQLKGRGITLVKQYTEKDFCNAGDHRVGWFEYQVTTRAFEKLKEQYSISMERCLD